MELHMDTHRWQRRIPDWPMAVASGFVAGAVLMVLELLWSASFGAVGPWSTAHSIAALIMGPGVLQSTGYSTSVMIAALITHYVLGIAFGIILAAISAPFRLDSSIGVALITGLVYGLLLYLFNFYGMERIFPWFNEMRGWATLVAHLIFGVVLAALYWRWERPEPEQQP